MGPPVSSISCPPGGEPGVPTTTLSKSSPSHINAQEKLRADAERLLQIWRHGGSIAEYRHGLPAFLPEATLKDCVSKFRSTVTALLHGQVSSAAAMQTATLLAETTSCPFAVMLMAASHSSATPV